MRRVAFLDLVVLALGAFSLADCSCGRSEMPTGAHCSTDIDCAGPTWCDPATSTCKAICLTDRDCPAGKLCDPSGRCLSPCGPGAPCGAGLACVDGYCVKGCADSTDCPPNQGCANGRCWPRDCGSVTCSQGQLCFAGQCVEDVCAGVVCAAGMACADGRCVPTSCGGQECPASMVCLDGVCQSASCAGVLCPAGTVCGNGRCVPKDCPDQKCEPNEGCDNGHCVTLDCVGVICAAGQVCANGRCWGETCPGAAAPCPDGQVCVNGACQDIHCAGIQCAAGQVCAGGACLLADCIGDDCPSDQVCASGRCQTLPCAAVRCERGEVCRSGTCYPTSCPSGPCPTDFVCDSGTCVPLRCAGVRCDAAETCAADGVCYPRQCFGAGRSCPGLFVCVSGQCVDPLCVDLSCPAGTACAGGTCWPQDPPIGPACGSARAYIEGACQDLTCYGVRCAAGQDCYQGTCDDSAGVFLGGWTAPAATSDASKWTGVVARRAGGAWKKLNTSALPALQQLELGPDGSTLYAVTLDGNLYVSSSDGALWSQRWTGDASSGWIEWVDVTDQLGVLHAAINMAKYNGGTATPGTVQRSVNNGDSWSVVWTGWDSCWFTYCVGLQPRGVGRSPADRNRLWLSFGADGTVVTNGGWGVSRMDGNGQNAVQTWSGKSFGIRPHPTDPDRALVFDGAMLRGQDGVVLGAFGPTSWQLQFDPADARRIFAATGTQVRKSTDGGQSWKSSSAGLPASVAMSGLALHNGGLFVGSTAGGSQVVFRSSDDGDTFGDITADMAIAPGLVDAFAAWAPTTDYADGTHVVPTALNGHRYRVTGGAGKSDTVEPVWPTAAAGTVKDGTVTWVEEGAQSAMRVSAIAARPCPPGQTFCAAGCVPTDVDPKNCGACGHACPHGVGCYVGHCLMPQAGSADGGVEPPSPVDGLSIGCRDGSREGFKDVVGYPTIAACAGRWAGQLMEPSADLICADGWHVCSDRDAAAWRISSRDARGFPGCFAYRAAQDFPNDSAHGYGCRPLTCVGSRNPNDPTDPMPWPDDDDVAGMGAGCSKEQGGIDPYPAGASGKSCLTDGYVIDASCCYASRQGGCTQQPWQTGVVCCKD